MAAEPARAWWLAGALCACGAAAAEPAALSIASPVVAELRAGEVRRHALQLGEQVCAFAKLQPSAAEIEVRVLRPRQTAPLRSLRAASGHGLDLDFCVEAAGSYLLELRARSAGAYQLTLEAVLPRAASPPPTAASASPPESPRLRTLAAQLAAGERDTAAFWAGLHTPLIEARGPDAALVTFLYRATPRTRAVSVNWPAWTYSFADNAMTRLAESDVFWKSIVLPRATRISYQLLVDPALAANSAHPLAERAQNAAASADPRNPKRDDPQPGERSLLELPDAPPERWLSGHGPAGRLERQRFASRVLGNERELTAYLPPGYSRAHAPYPLLILFDGESYLERIRTPKLLDQLIAARAITPLIAVFVHNATSDSRARELPCNAAFADFVANELTPFLRDRYRIVSDPAQVALAGSSFGGLASSYIALLHPELFGVVISQSGSYWWTFPATSPAFDGSEKPGWLRRRYREHPRVPIRFYLSAGAFEGDPAGSGVLDQTRQEVSALRDLGYSVAYQEFTGGHDFSAWRATLPDALRALFPP